LSFDAKYGRDGDSSLTDGSKINYDELMNTTYFTPGQNIKLTQLDQTAALLNLMA
jgi:hypothetical protein